MLGSKYERRRPNKNTNLVIGINSIEHYNCLALVVIGHTPKINFCVRKWHLRGYEKCSTHVTL